MKPAILFVIACAAGCDARAYPLSNDSPGPNVDCPTDMVGFATQGDSTTGGGSAAPVTVSTLEDFTTYANAIVPEVIKVSGMLTFPPPTDGSPNQITVVSDKTIIGIGASSGFLGGGLDLSSSQNVIIKNLVIAKALDTDAITLKLSKNIWIDHCDLSSERNPDADAGVSYDGLVDITHATDFVTVSWTRYHDHDDTGIIGHSADNGEQDTNHLTVTYHHDLFQNVTAGPTARFGTVHVYNTYFDQISDHALVSRTLASMLVEKNKFEDVVLPIATMYGDDPLGGAAADVGNLVDATDGASLITATTTWEPPYPYTADSNASVALLVQACAGTGKI